MSRAYAAIAAAIKATADTGSALAKVVFGTPGSTVEYPTDGSFQDTRDTGGLWAGEVFPLALDEVGGELDKDGHHWAVLLTAGAGNPVTYSAFRGISSATKDEVNDRLTVNLDPGYTSANYTFFARIDDTMSFTVDVTKSNNSCTFELWSQAGAKLGINNRTVYFLACGQA